MTDLCSENETCQSYSSGGKRKSHHIRMTVPCVLEDDCPELGKSCNLEKMRAIRKEMGFE